MQEYRYRTKRQIVVARREIGGSGNLRDVEFATAQEAPVPRRRIHVGQDGEVNAVDLDLFIEQRTNKLVVTAGKRQRNFFRHLFQIPGFMAGAGCRPSAAPARGLTASACRLPTHLAPDSR